MRLGGEFWVFLDCSNLIKLKPFQHKALTLVDAFYGDKKGTHQISVSIASIGQERGRWGYGEKKGMKWVTKRGRSAENWTGDKKGTKARTKYWVRICSSMSFEL